MRPDLSREDLRGIRTLVRVLGVLVPVALVAGLVGGYLWGRSQGDPQSAVATVEAVTSRHGAEEPPVVCLAETPFGAEYGERCGEGYATDGLPVGPALVGKKVRVVRLDRQVDGLNVMLLSRP